MKTNELFRQAMARIGDKALHYNPSHDGEITEYLNTLANRTKSEKRRANYLALAEAILDRDVGRVNLLCEAMSRPPVKRFVSTPNTSPYPFGTP